MEILENIPSFFNILILRWNHVSNFLYGDVLLILIKNHLIK